MEPKKIRAKAIVRQDILGCDSLGKMFNYAKTGETVILFELREDSEGTRYVGRVKRQLVPFLIYPDDIERVEFEPNC